MSVQNPIQHLVACLSRLPGVGEKTATRLALYLVNCPREEALDLARSIDDARRKVSLCSRCFNYAEGDVCSICSETVRDHTTVCVVETPADILSIERTGGYRGVYHVLHGSIVPLDGIGPEQLRISELVERIRAGGVDEVIIATNPTMSGNATAAYIADRLKSGSAKVSRIAQGIPSGGDIGYVDTVTLKNALDGRRCI